MKFRIEKDTMGPVEVPAEKYWGAQHKDPKIISRSVIRKCLTR